MAKTVNSENSFGYCKVAKIMAICVLIV